MELSTNDLILLAVEISRNHLRDCQNLLDEKKSPEDQISCMTLALFYTNALTNVINDIASGEVSSVEQFNDAANDYIRQFQPDAEYKEFVGLNKPRLELV